MKWIRLYDQLGNNIIYWNVSKERYSKIWLKYWFGSFTAVGLYLAGAFGITAGAHRLWAHRSYKAKLPLRVLLTIFNTMAFQDCVIHWARDHRVHHKYSETDADPHNATRYETICMLKSGHFLAFFPWLQILICHFHFGSGFFFAHCGWLLCRKHPEVISKGKGLDITDLENDPILHFQRK